MKKLSLLFALLAGIAVMTGCKKDQTVVTLEAVIDQNTKAYFGTPVRPYWDTDDQVCIMGAGYSGKLTCELSDVLETYAKSRVCRAAPMVITAPSIRSMQP